MESSAVRRCVDIRTQPQLHIPEESFTSIVIYRSIQSEPELHVIVNGLLAIANLQIKFILLKIGISEEPGIFIKF